MAEFKKIRDKQRCTNMQRCLQSLFMNSRTVPFDNEEHLQFSPPSSTLHKRKGNNYNQTTPIRMMFFLMFCCLLEKGMIRGIWKIVLSRYAIWSPSDWPNSRNWPKTERIIQKVLCLLLKKTLKIRKNFLGHAVFAVMSEKVSSFVLNLQIYKFHG